MAEPHDRLWIRVVQVHAAKTWVAIILAISAGASLFAVVGGAVWNTISNPEVTDISQNFMTLISGALGVILGGLTNFLGSSVQQTRKAQPGEIPGDEDLVLDVDKPPEEPPK